MRLVPTLMCEAGMKLGKAIYSDEGNVLLGYRVELTQTIIKRLYQMGFEYLYIYDPRTDDINYEDPIRTETRIAVRSALGKVLDKLMSGAPAFGYGSGPAISYLCMESVKMLLDDLADQKEDMIMLMNMYVVNSDPFRHQFLQNALNVAIYAVKLAMMENYTREEISAICYGSLLKDIGLTQVPTKLLEKKGRLTMNEFLEVQKHTELGFKILAEDGGIPLLSAHCALQHHERFDGSGYPWGLKGENIHKFARWMGLIDSYDAMTNPRAFRQAMLPHQAVEVLYAGAGSLYEMSKVELFRNKVAIYPLGLGVTLSSGESGVISHIHPSYKHRPTVRILNNAWGEEVERPYDLELSKNHHIIIDGVGERFHMTAV